MPEEDEVRYGASTISYTVVRSARRKRTIEIRLDSSGGATVAVPLGASPQAIRDAVLGRAKWILAKAGEPRVVPACAFVSGETVPCMGRETPMKVVRAAVAKVQVRHCGASFAVVVPFNLAGDDHRAAVRKAFVSWYRVRADEAVRLAIERWSGVMGLAVARYLIRDQKRRWGSCARDGKLRFNWRLAMVDPALLDYVVVHEMAHLVERSHSKAFWAVVARFMPDWDQRRRQLRQVEARAGIS